MFLKDPEIAVNQCAVNGTSPVYIASQCGREPIVKKLLADLKGKDYNKYVILNRCLKSRGDLKKVAGSLDVKMSKVTYELKRILGTVTGRKLKDFLSVD